MGRQRSSKESIDTPDRDLRDSTKLFQVPMHPEVIMRLRIAALEDDLKPFEKLHSILCHEFGLEHLLFQAPDPAVHSD